MGGVDVVASFRASNILFISACASFILSFDGCVGPAIKLNSEVFCSLITVKSSESTL